MDQESVLLTFSVVVIEYHNQKNLEKKALNWACVSLGLESMMVELRYGDRNS